MDDLSDFVLLPPEIQLQILHQLSPDDLMKYCNLSKYHKEICDLDFSYWKQRIENECPEYHYLDTDINKNNFVNKYLECKKSRENFKRDANPYFGVSFNPHQSIINHIRLTELNIEQHGLDALKNAAYIDCINLPYYIKTTNKNYVPLLKYLIDRFNLDPNIVIPQAFDDGNSSRFGPYLFNRLYLYRKFIEAKYIATKFNLPLTSYQQHVLSQY